MKKILSIGETVIDQLIILSKFPKPGEKIDNLKEMFSFGGTVCLISLFLSKMGLNVDFYTNLGNDHEGWQAKRFLEKNKLKTKIFWQSKTQKNLVLLTENKRTIIKKNIEKKLIDYVSEKSIEESEAIIIDRHNLHLLTTILSKKNKNSILIFDPSANFSLFYLNALKLTDFIIIPIEFLDNFYKKELGNYKKKILDFFNVVKKPVIVTANNLGIFFTEEKNKIFHFPAIFEKIIDPTGAGDLFRGGFIFYFLKTKKFLDSVIFANIVAGFQCQRIGSSNAIVSKKELAFFLKEKPIKSFYKKITIL
ncbi:MAG: carbohydrate kinase family protein [Patescibacteria group bacterium]|nr:carbohydrate kinase family protein [Patescibacteria group bacterium]